MPPDNVSCTMPWTVLTNKLSHIGLMPHDVGGSGDCFFKSVSHQLYKTRELHMQIRLAGIRHLKEHPEIYIESLLDTSWQTYIQQMSQQGTWCDNVIIQAVANVHKCIIHITDSDINKPEGTVITPVIQEEKRKVIFIGYINELHYVSTVPLKNSCNRNRFKYLKSKLSETAEQKQKRLAKKRKATSMVTTEGKKVRLANQRERKAKKNSEESVSGVKKPTNDKPLTKQNKVDKSTYNIGLNCTQTQNISEESDDINHHWTPIMEQEKVLKNLDLFHKSNVHSVYQCTISQEAWPIKSTSNTRSSSEYCCLRCKRDKKHPKKFSRENNLIPTAVPCELQGLTQVEEMLIARALPIMRAYIKPGGQRGYSGHCINLPQHVEELATSLPRYPKDLSVIIVKMKGKDNSYKDLTVRRQNVADALHWLLNNNQHYRDVVVNQNSLNYLPENGVPQDLLTVETESDDTDSSYLNFSPQNDEDIVYNEQTEMNSFLPIPQCQPQEIEAVQQQLHVSCTHTNSHQDMHWPSVDKDLINEYTTPFLATMAFPTLFPDGRGDPTNPCLFRDVSLAEQIKHLLKFAEKKDGKWFYRFASHPRFAYWALNMIQRKRVLQQTAIFLKQNPGEAHLTSEELKEIAANNSANGFSF